MAKNNQKQVQKRATGFFGLEALKEQRAAYLKNLRKHQTQHAKSPLPGTK